jgi:hypothetical protein
MKATRLMPFVEVYVHVFHLPQSFVNLVESQPQYMQFLRNFDTLKGKLARRQANHSRTGAANVVFAVHAQSASDTCASANAQEHQWVRPKSAKEHQWDRPKTTNEQQWDHAKTAKEHLLTSVTPRQSHHVGHTTSQTPRESFPNAV